MLRFVWCLAVVLGVKATSAPFIKPCKPGDAPCIQASAQAAVPFLAAGIPELGVKSLDPLQLDVIESNQGELSLTFSDNVVTGLKGCTIESIKHQLNKGKQILTVKCNVDMVGNYKLSGKLLIFPVNGEGKYNIKIRDIVIKTNSQIVTVDGADGKKHWHIDSWNYASDVKTNANFNFENLFNGNKILAEPVEGFLNTNWHVVMQEIAPPIVRAIVSRVVDNVETLYKAVPAEELEQI